MILLNDVPVAMPILGVTSVGLVANTLFPEPVEGVLTHTELLNVKTSFVAGVGTVTLFKESKLIFPPTIAAAFAALVAAAAALFALAVAELAELFALVKASLAFVVAFVNEAVALVAEVAELELLVAALVAEADASPALVVAIVA